MAFVLPSKRDAGYLDPSIAGEGAKVIMSDGDVITYNPPPPRPVMPDWSTIKSIRHYFNRTDFRVWPAWLYHPKEAPRLVKNQDEAAELGVCYRESTIDEKGRYGRDHVWDWQDDCQWRPQPWPGTQKFDPNKAEQGKTYIASPVNPTVAQNELAALLIPQVAAAVAQALRASGPAAPASVDPAQWDQFLQFQAWQKSAEVVGGAMERASQPEAPVLGLQGGGAQSGPEAERAAWEAAADQKGIKIDRRWSLERLKSEVEKAA
jgi:hypothetical protein